MAEEEISLTSANCPPSGDVKIRVIFCKYILKTQIHFYGFPFVFLSQNIGHFYNFFQIPLLDLVFSDFFFNVFNSESDEVANSCITKPTSSG